MLEELVVAREQDAAVELEVRLEVCGLVIDPGLHARVCLRDADDLLGRRARRGEPGRERFDREPDLRRLLVEPLVVRRLAPPAEHVRVEDVPIRSRPDARAGLRLRLDEPLGGENADGLADDGAADREIRDELVLGRKGSPGSSVPVTICIPIVWTTSPCSPRRGYVSGLLTRAVGSSVRW